MTVFPHTIREINSLPDGDKREIFATLVPQWIYEEFQIDRTTISYRGINVLHMMSRPNTRSVEIFLRRELIERDPIMYLHMVDTFNGQIMVLLLVMNDVDSPRFNTDLDLDGNATQYGTVSRNYPAERAAMAAGLAPGQIYRGLRGFKRVLPYFETFVENMGHELFIIEPLAYHNAILFERYGFNYLRGLNDMREIDEQFAPGNSLHTRLTPDNPFRQPDAWQTVRGRSWAIHDGILGHPYTGFQMYKRLGIDAGVNTFIDARW